MSHPFTDRRLIATGTAVALLTGAIPCLPAISASQASASPVSCGDTITTDTTLDSDLIDCPNNGIIIGADDVTLDLNGHTIDGDGTPDSACNPGPISVISGSALKVTMGSPSSTARYANSRAASSPSTPARSRLLDLATSRSHFGNIGVANSARILVAKLLGKSLDLPRGEWPGLVRLAHVRVLHSSFRHNVHVGIKPIGSTNSLIKANLIGAQRR